MSWRISGTSSRRRPRFPVVREVWEDTSLQDCVSPYRMSWMAWLVPPRVKCVRLNIKEPCDVGESKEVVGGVTVMHRRCELEGLLQGGEWEEALFVAFLAKVSTKLDFKDRDTDDSVAWRRCVRSVGEGGSFRQVDDVERSAFRYSMVVVVVVFGIGGRWLVQGRVFGPWVKVENWLTVELWSVPEKATQKPCRKWG